MKKRATRTPQKVGRATTEYMVKETTAKRIKRTDSIIWLRQKYVGDLHANPATFNQAFANVLREMADAVANVKNAWVDPEVVVWTHVEGEITAEATLSPVG